MAGLLIPFASFTGLARRCFFSKALLRVPNRKMNNTSCSLARRATPARHLCTRCAKLRIRLEAASQTRCAALRACWEGEAGDPWGGPVWSHDGMLCLCDPLKNVVGKSSFMMTF